MSLDPSYATPRPRSIGSGGGLLRWLTSVLVVAALWWAWTAFDAKFLRPMNYSNIYDVLARQRNAWNEGRLEDFMAEYWQSDDLTFFSGGTVTTGWQPTLDRYRKRYQGKDKEMGQLEFDGIKIDVVSSDTATARGHWKVVTSKESFEGLFTLVLKRIDGRWKIVHDHTSAADPPTPPVHPEVPAKKDEGRPATGTLPTP